MWLRAPDHPSARLGMLDIELGPDQGPPIFRRGFGKIWRAFTDLGNVNDETNAGTTDSHTFILTIDAYPTTQLSRAAHILRSHLADQGLLLWS